MRLLVLVPIGLLACQPTGGGDVPTTSTGGSTLPVTGTPTGTPAGSTTSTGTEPTGPEFDCAAIPTTPLEINFLGEPRGYHDVAFSDDGWIIGNSSGFVNNDLIQVDAYDNVEVLVPNTGLLQQMAWLPDGDLAVAADNSGGIFRVSRQGAFSLISPSVYAYGLILGPDGKLWAANQNVVMRIDIATGSQDVVLSNIPRGTPRVINFNRDHTRLYIGTLGGNGDVYQVDLDANYDPVGQVEVLATGVGSGDYHDGLGVDICGYLYIPDYSTSALYRISPSGDQVQALYDSNLSEYGHGVEWGNGVGPWRTDAIYLPRPYGQHQVVELVIGVPTVWDGVVVNAPLP